jgi:large subunit ribosomal protein L25
MEEIKLDVQIRKEHGTRKITRIRREDLIPGVIYGGKQKTSTLVQVDRRTYEKIMRQHQGQSVLFHLNVLEGDKKLRDYSAIVKEEQHHPVSYNLLHLDFNRISLTEEIEVKIPIVVKGDAVGVKRDGGSLEQSLWELEVRCLPTKIPQKVEVDVSALTIGDSIHVKDIVLPEGVQTKHDGEGMVASVVPPMKEEVAAPAATEEAMTEPEVIKKKKADKEGEAVEGADAKAPEKAKAAPEKPKSPEKK